MKAKHYLCKSCQIVGYVLFLLVGGVLPGAGDIGGGPGSVKTPYKIGSTVTEEEIAKVKEITNGRRSLEDVPLRGTNKIAFGNDVGLMFVKDNTVAGEPTFQFRGKDESGSEVIIDFSQVESFSLVKFQDRWFWADRAKLEVVVFPSISVDELLEERPSYSELRNKHRRTVSMWLEVESRGKGKLCFVGTKLSDERVVIARLDEIVPNSKIELAYGFFRWEDLNLPAIWWAIESVVKDEDYPHKIHPAER